MAWGVAVSIEGGVGGVEVAGAGVDGEGGHAARDVQRRAAGGVEAVAGGAQEAGEDAAVVAAVVDGVAGELADDADVEGGRPAGIDRAAVGEGRGGDGAVGEAGAGRRKRAAINIGESVGVAGFAAGGRGEVAEPGERGGGRNGDEGHGGGEGAGLADVMGEDSIEHSVHFLPGGRCVRGEAWGGA